MISKGLQYHRIGSDSCYEEDISLGELRSRLHSYKLGDAFVIAYLDYKIIAGRYGNDKFLFLDNDLLEEKFIKRIRVFNKYAEFHAWRTKNCFHVRYRSDDYTKSDVEIIVAEQVIFGTECKTRDDGYSEIFEERGTRIVLPFQINQFDNNLNRLFLKTHNYIGYNSVFQASYVDCRFVAFTDADGNSIQ